MILVNERKRTKKMELLLLKAQLDNCGRGAKLMVVYSFVL